MKDDIRVLSLFAGCGGLTEGFRRSGFRIVAANELVEAAADTFQYNHPGTTMVRGDICDTVVRDAVCGCFDHERCDVIIGGPPCQAYSMAGKRDPNDPRGKLFKEYAKVVDRLRPEVFVMENVTGILTMMHGSNKVIDLITGEFGGLGYKMRWQTLNAAAYGVPQKRERVIFVGTRRDVPVMYPKPVVGYGLVPYVTARQAIDELKDMKDDLGWWHIRMRHSPEFVEKIRRTPCGKSVTGYSEAFFRLMPDEPTKTVKANNGSVFVHYEWDRTLTPREMATLQSFGYEYRFSGSKGDVLTQIGNSVPPLMAEAVAGMVGNILREDGNGKKNSSRR